MTNRVPQDLIPSLAHEDPLVRRYTARLLGLDAEAGEVEQYLKSSLVQGTAPLRRVAARAMGELVADWTLGNRPLPWCKPWLTRTAASKISRRKQWAGGEFRKPRKFWFRRCLGPRRRRRRRSASPWASCGLPVQHRR